MPLAHPQQRCSLHAAQLLLPMQLNGIDDPGHSDLRQHAIPPAHTGQIVCSQTRTYLVSATAEMESLLRLGTDITPMRWIDLMAEASMITGTHRKMWVPKPTLLNHLRVFEIGHEGDSEHKRRMRDLILSDRGFSRDEWDGIVRYCWSDV